MGERLAQTMDADKVLHVAQVLVAVTPDPTGDLEFNQGLHGGNAHAIYFYPQSPTQELQHDGDILACT